MFKGEAFNKRAAICVAAAMMCGVILAGITYIRMLPVEWDAGAEAVGMPHLFLTNTVKSWRRNIPAD